jgi:FAD:protein FMN transferase
VTTATLDESVTSVSRTAPLMGGQVGIHLDVPERADAAIHDADAALRRISAWADRLTRFTDTSELSRLNLDPRSAVAVGPTMATILDWGRSAEGLTGGVVDIGLLDARLEAESGTTAGRSTFGRSPRSAASRRWSLERRARGAVVHRPSGVRFDLDGVGKGWLADRALDLLHRYGAAVVDADGDIAIRLDEGRTWFFGVADPMTDGHDLAILRLSARVDGSSQAGRFGLATSGTSVHHWGHGERATHHLIDPRTGCSATTDVVQATVLAGTARRAEALAKAVVILGSNAGLELLDRVGVDGALLLTDDRSVLIHPSTDRWLS